MTRDRAALLARAGEVVREGLGILGVRAESGAEAAVPEAIMERVREREAARRARNWALADQLRQEIKNQGFTIEDRDGGPVVIRST